MGSSIKLAWRNMWRNWRRTTIALVAIVLGVILLLFFDGLIHGSDAARRRRRQAHQYRRHGKPSRQHYAGGDHGH